jgi:hypothetical protein
MLRLIELDQLTDPEACEDACLATTGEGSAPTAPFAEHRNVRRLICTGTTFQQTNHQ